MPSAGNSCNSDDGVSFTPGQIESGAESNERPARVLEELLGLSVFAIDEEGAVYHTCAVFSRGLAAVNAADQHLDRRLDLRPRGRSEPGLRWPWHGCAGMMNTRWHECGPVPARSAPRALAGRHDSFTALISIRIDV